MHLRLTLLLFLFIAACSTDETVRCYDLPGEIRLSGFDSSELINVQERAFVGNGNFDSLLYTNTLVIGFTLPVINGSARIINVVETDTLDFEIEIPAAGRMYQISKITREPQHDETFKRSFFNKKEYDCTNKLLTYSLNGETRHWQDGSYQYINLIK